MSNLTTSAPVLGSPTLTTYSPIHDPSWATAVSGDFADPRNWDPAIVPGPTDDVVIAVDGTYTITSSANESINSLSIQNQNATLAINSSELDVSGSVNDAGTIDLVGGGQLVAGGDVNVSGTINADGTAVSRDTITASNLNNSGTIDNTGTLFVNAEVSNPGLIDSTSKLVINGDLSDPGTVDVANHSIAIIGGSLNNPGSIDVTDGARLTVDGATNNPGTISADNSHIVLIGPVNNPGTILSDNSTIVLDSAISGGKAVLDGSGAIEFDGAVSQNTTVVFASTASGAVAKLADASAFAGTVKGLTSGNYLDLTNIAFADGPTVKYAHNQLTVSDPITSTVDVIKVQASAGTTFTASPDSSGGTNITDPPVTVHADQFVFSPTLGVNNSSSPSVVQHDEPLPFLLHHGGELADLAALVQAETAHHDVGALATILDTHYVAALVHHHLV